jgi:hypothetical protein
MRRYAISILALAVLAALVPPAMAQTTTFSDATFLNADWTITTEIINLGGTVTGTQVASGGTSGPYRRIVNTLNSAIGFGFSNTVYGFHARAGAAFDPITTGAITSIDYSESSIRLAAGQQACAIALRQGGVIYYGPGFLNPSTLNVWVPTTQTGLTATSFDAAAPGVQNPDFSAAGAPIQFGFSRSNSTSVGGGGSTLTGGIDDWVVTVHFNAATPTRGTSWGALKAGYLNRR